MTVRKGWAELREAVRLTFARLTAYLLWKSGYVMRQKSGWASEKGSFGQSGAVWPCRLGSVSWAATRERGRFWYCSILPSSKRSASAAAWPRRVCALLRLAALASARLRFSGGLVLRWTTPVAEWRW